MDIEEELRQTKKRLAELEAENKRMRASPDQNTSSSNRRKVPTNILKSAFTLNEDITERILEVEWAALPNEEKKKLFKTTVDELEAHGVPMTGKKETMESLRRYYNSRRRTLTVKKSPRKRRHVRKMSKLAVLNHRLRNNDVKNAIKEGTLSVTDEVAVKNFKKGLQGKTATEVISPPNSDDEEGKAEQKKNRLDALAKANRKRAEIFARAREEIFGETGSQLTSTPVSSSSRRSLLPATNVTPIVPSNLHREWDIGNPDSGWSWERVQALQFRDIRAIMAQQQFSANFGNCQPKDLENLCPGVSWKTKLMNSLVESLVSFINDKKIDSYARALSPVLLNDIVSLGDGTYEIRSKEMVKQIEETKLETQSNFQNKILVTPVITSIVAAGRKICYWAIAFAILDYDGENQILLLDPIKDKGKTDVWKISYFYDQLAVTQGSWELYSNGSWEKLKKVKLPKASKVSESGVISFMYALHVVCSARIPTEVNSEDARLWILNEILNESQYDDDETQFML